MPEPVNGTKRIVLHRDGSFRGFDRDDGKKGAIVMPVVLNSTTAKVRDFNKVRDILCNYEWRCINFQLEKARGKKGTLALTRDNDDMDDWPEALKLEDLPCQEEFEDKDSWFDAEFEAFCEKGDEGFLALLNELAPFLETQLLILALQWPDFPQAVVWCVQPDCKDVLTLHASFA
jgi:hypothetical protein